MSNGEEATMPVAFSVDPETLRKFKLWFKVYGVILILLGLACILWPQLGTLAATISVGWFLIAGGIAVLLGANQWRSQS